MLCIAPMLSGVSRDLLTQAAITLGDGYALISCAARSPRPGVHRIAARVGIDAKRYAASSTKRNRRVAHEITKIGRSEHRKTVRCDVNERGGTDRLII